MLVLEDLQLLLVSKYISICARIEKGFWKRLGKIFLQIFHSKCAEKFTTYCYEKAKNLHQYFKRKIGLSFRCRPTVPALDFFLLEGQQFSFIPSPEFFDRTAAPSIMISTQLLTGFSVPRPSQRIISKKVTIARVSSSPFRAAKEDNV